MVVPDVDAQQGPGRGIARWRAAGSVVLVAVLVLAVGGCGDDGDPDGGGDAGGVAEEAEELAEGIGAVALAQVLRGSLAAQDVDDDAERRDVEVIEDAVDDLPGDPEVVGIEDGDGDGRDDDGRVGVRVGDEEACLAIAEDGDTDVDDSAC